MINRRGPCNPTKLLLCQQPWFNASWYAARRAWHTVWHQLGVKHSTTRAAYGVYTRACKGAYTQFVSDLPALLQRNPKLYFDTIYPSRGQHTHTGCSVESYEQHCQRVFHLPTEPVQQVKAQPNPTHLPLDATSIRFILDHAYKGNKASGPSYVPP